MGDAGDERLRASYGDANYERLVALKRRYDPDEPLPPQPEHHPVAHAQARSTRRATDHPHADAGGPTTAAGAPIPPERRTPHEATPDRRRAPRGARHHRSGARRRRPAITEKVLGAASISHPYTIHVKKPADVVVAKATVPPGASFGWHSHRAAVVAVVKSGTLTLYDSADPTCTPQRYSAGQGFIEQPAMSISPATKAASRSSSSSPTSGSSTASTPTCRPRAPGTVPSSTTRGERHQRPGRQRVRRRQQSETTGEAPCRPT